MAQKYAPRLNFGLERRTTNLDGEVLVAELLVGSAESRSSRGGRPDLGDVQLSAKKQNLFPALPLRKLRACALFVCSLKGGMGGERERENTHTHTPTHKDTHKYHTNTHLDGFGGGGPMGAAAACGSSNGGGGRFAKIWMAAWFAWNAVSGVEEA